MSATLKWTKKTIMEYTKEFGYKSFPVSGDTPSSKMCFECPEGHQYMTTFKMFLNGNRCPKCWELKKLKITANKRKTRLGY